MTINIPVELLPIDETASVRANEQFTVEYEGSVCAVCNSSKWKNSPFCRGCSIRLQRAHLMRQFGRWQELIPQVKDAGLRNQYWQLMAKHYDLCRAYLIDLRRIA